MLAACARGGDAPEALPDGEEPGPRLPYEVRLEGPLDPGLTAALRAASSAVRLAERPPADELQLARRAERDLPALQAALRGLGYYRGTVGVVVEPPAPPPSPPPDAPAAVALAEPRALVRFTVEPGPLYRFARRTVEIVGEPHGFEAPPPGKLGLERDGPAIAQLVLDAEAALVRAAQRTGHAFARAGPREVVVDHDRRTMDVTLRLEPGRAFRLGPIGFKGADGISERYLARLLTAREGSRFDLEELERGRDLLGETGLFSTVRLVVAEAPDASGRLPITYEVVQRKHRTVGGGIGYLTDEGPNVRAFWEHRNLLGAGERLRTDLGVSPVRQSAEAQFRKPEVGARGQSLLAGGALLAERLDAYDARSAKVSGGLERRLARGLVGSLGLAYRFADIEDRGEEERFGLLSAPGRLSFDASDDLFDPSRGGRVAVELAPFADTLAAGSRFFKGRLVATAYLPVRNSPRLVLAGRSAVGAIGGAARDSVPADERWYAGGGGSIRGVPFQKAGPLDRHDDPVGGRSFLELSTELRWSITETIGVVGFLDTGSAYPESVPDPAAGLRWGAGLGLRYATPVGPLRLDVGVPVDRQGVDDPFQLYLSLGQAF
jgi:translocation and assembly module TamA